MHFDLPDASQVVPAFFEVFRLATAFWKASGGSCGLSTKRMVHLSLYDAQSLSGVIGNQVDFAWSGSIKPAQNSQTRPFT